MTHKRKLILFIIPLIFSIIIYGIVSRPNPPESAELDIYFKAAADYDKGDFNSVLILTLALADKCPAFFQARLLLGKAQFFSGNMIDAGETFDELIKDKSNYYEAEIWNLRCKIQTGEIESAKIFGDEILSRSPEDPRILGLLARIAALQNNYQQALEYYSRSVLFEEELAINRVDTAKIYFFLFNPEEAAVQLEKAAVLASDDSPLNPALADLVKKIGETK